MSRAFISLHSGKRFYFDDVMTNEIDIEDVACGLAHLCRYNGQMGNIDDFYTVAEHSVHVSNKIEEELHGGNFSRDDIRITALCGLLHDASESLMGDEVSPLKKLNIFFKKKELEIEELMGKRFGIPYPFPPIVKQVDVKMFACEYGQVFPKAAANNVNPFDIITVVHTGLDEETFKVANPYPDLKLHMYGPRQAYEFFMARFRELGGK